MRIETIVEQSSVFRGTITKLLQSIAAEQADKMPPTWNNNARWHAGHLVVTPRLLTYGLLKQPLGVSEDYRKWFAKGTSPKEWGNDPVPSYEELVSQVTPTIETLFSEFGEQMSEPFENPYLTSVGVTLNNPLEALNFSMAHDGIHLGMLLALRRALA